MNRNLPIFELAFAKKNEQKNLPVVRLVTLWLGEFRISRLTTLYDESLT